MQLVLGSKGAISWGCSMVISDVPETDAAVQCGQDTWQKRAVILILYVFCSYSIDVFSLEA